MGSDGRRNVTDVDHTVAARLLLEESRRFGELFDGADWNAPVLTCGDWTAEKLLRHTGRGEWWAAHIVASRATEAVAHRDTPNGAPPDGQAPAIEWFTAGSQHLVDAVATTGPDYEVWTFNGPKPAAWWLRRRLHEVLVHRADAALAFGVDFDVAPDLAADCVTEWIELQAHNSSAGSTLDEGTSVHLHATDDGLGVAGEWTVRGGPDGITWSHDHEKGSVAVRGPARELVLVITRRRATDDANVEVFGDRAVWERWLDGTPFG